MPLELTDTINMMVSSDYKERFRGEYFQLLIRRDKLNAMLTIWDGGGFKPTCPRDMYVKQLDSMNTYLSILENRAELEGIDLTTK